MKIKEGQLELERQLLDERSIKSVIALKDGEVAGEWHERGEDAMAPLYSCTKSVLSALLGIALERGDILSIELPLSHYWKTGDAAQDARLAGITIAHLLTMTPGFDWPDFDKPYKELRASADPVGFALGRPVIHEPGTAFTYNSGGSHLLSAIVTKATGMSALQYAKAHLFGPLGFKAARWSERAGVSEGGTGLSLYGHDLAKLGALYLQEGRWEGRQLVPRQWVRDSVRMRHRGLLHYEPPIYGGYGYHWWISPAEHNGCSDCFFAFGHGGQYLLVIPEHGIVVVLRKRITKRNDAILSRRLIFEHIVPGILNR